MCWRPLEGECINRLYLPLAGSCFLRTDQLDGETDWKLRLPVACTQRLPTAAVSHRLSLQAQPLEAQPVGYFAKPTLQLHNSTVGWGKVKPWYSTLLDFLGGMNPKMCECEWVRVMLEIGTFLEHNFSQLCCSCQLKIYHFKGHRLCIHQIYLIHHNHKWVVMQFLWCLFASILHKSVVVLKWTTHFATLCFLTELRFLFPKDLLQIRSYVYAEEPNIDIHTFNGTFTRVRL